MEAYYDTTKINLEYFIYFHILLTTFLSPHFIFREN